MKTLVKLGGIGAILQSVYFIALIIIVAVLMPSEGFAGDATAFHTPALALPYATQSLFFPENYWGSWVYAGGLLVASLATYERLHNAAPGLMRPALALGLIGAGLSLAEAAVGTKVIAELAALYPTQPTEVGPAYLAINLLTGGLRVASWHAYGWWVLLTSWAGLQAKVFSRPLWLMGLVVGVVGISTLVSALVIVHVLLGFVWPLWLGLTLLRAPNEHRSL